jgi:hypothetical protein
MKLDTFELWQWHLGYATYDMLPSGRGFDTSFHYQEGAMDHWSSCNCVDGMCSAPNNGYSNAPNSSARSEHCWGTIAKPDAAPVDDCRAKPGCKDSPRGAGPGTLLEMAGQGVADLWCTDKPCYGRNNTGEYNDLLFTQEAIRLIEANDPMVPFFMYFALQVNHSPLEVPFEYMNKYPEDQYWNQRIMNGMSNFWDESTTLLRRFIYCVLVCFLRVLRQWLYSIVVAFICRTVKLLQCATSFDRVVCALCVFSGGSDYRHLQHHPRTETDRHVGKDTFDHERRCKGASNLPICNSNNR